MAELLEFELALDGGRAPNDHRRGIGRTLGVGFSVHFLIALINLLAVPLFLKLLGAQGYGLVTFSLVLQAWMALMDLGVSPTLARQLSRFRAGAVAVEEAASLMRAAESLFVTAGLIAGLAFVFGAPWIGSRWLGGSSLAPEVLDRSLRLMGALLVLRWLTTLYQSALVGLERQNRTNFVALIGAIGRYGGGLVVLVTVSASPVAFFVVQVVFTLAEAIACRVMLSAVLPRHAGAKAWPDGWRLLRREFNFAVGLTVAAAAGVLINQADKLALSHTLSLEQFGVFGLIVSIVGGIAMIVPPFVQVFQPRLTTLLAQGRGEAFVHVYRLAAGIIVALAAGLAGVIAARPEWVIWAWTGRADLAAELAPALCLYAAGSAIASYLFVPYLLQYAQGRVRLHVIGTSVWAVIGIPLAVWAAFAWGAVGTGAVWLAGNLAYLILWVPVIHDRRLTGAERAGLDAALWIRGGFIAALLAASRLIPVPPLARPAAFVALALTSLATMVLTAALAPEVRGWAAHGLANLRARR